MTDSHDLGSSNDSSGNQNSNKSGGSSSRLIINLVVLVVLLMGFYHWRSDNQLVTYHNEYFTKAYNSIFVDVWNKFIEQAKSGEMSDPQAAEFLKTKLLPVLNDWEKRADGIDVPTDAKEFHIRFTGELHEAAKKTQSVVQAIEDGESESGSESLKQLVLLVNKVEKDGANFQAQLKSDRNFEFEKSKPSAEKQK